LEKILTAQPPDAKLGKAIAPRRNHDPGAPTPASIRDRARRSIEFADAPHARRRIQARLGAKPPPCFRVTQIQHGVMRRFRPVESAQRKDLMMKRSVATFAALAAIAAAVPAFAQGNAYFDYQQFQPSRAELEQLARQKGEDQPTYALTGASRTRPADEKIHERAVQVPGNGFTPVNMPTDR
jgi:hypothetical protein